MFYKTNTGNLESGICQKRSLWSQLTLSLALFFFVFSSIPGLFGQSYTVKWYTSEQDQLPQNAIKSVVKDKYNFIWISTQNGLVRYDGNNFLTIDPHLSNIENRTAIIEGNFDKDSLIAFYPDGKAIAIINNRTAKTYLNDGKNRELSNYFDNNDRNIILNNRFPSATHFKERVKFNINDGSAFVVYNGKISYFSPQKKLRYSINFGFYNLYNFFIYKNEFYYLKSKKEVIKFNKNGIVTSYPTGLEFEGTDFHPFCNWVNQQFFIISQNKLYYFDASTKVPRFIKLYEAEFLTPKDICCLFYDKPNKTLFLGTLVKGLCVVKENYINILKKNKNEFESINAIAEIDNHHILNSSGNVFNKSQFIKKIDLPTRFGYSVVWDRGNYVFSNDSDTIYQYDIRNNYKREVSFDLNKRGAFKMLVRGKKDKIWFTTKFSMLENRIRFGYFTFKNGKSGKPVFFYCKPIFNTVEEFKEDKLLLGGENGLYQFDLKTKKLLWLYKNINIRTIFKTEDDFYWLTTYGNGLYLYYRGKIIRLPIYNKALLTPHCVIEDDRGFYWVSTNNGLFQFGKNNFLKYLTDATTPIFYYTYDKSDGLLNNEFNGGGEKSAVKFKSGELFFASMDGIVTFNSNKINPILPSRKLFVDRALVDNNVDHLVNDTLKLNKKFDNLILYVDNPHYGNAVNQKIEYSLQDDSNWLDIPESKTITVTNFKSGYTTIKIRTLNDFDGVYYTKNIVVFIQPLFYETQLFKIVLFAIFILLVYLIVKIRTAIIEKENLILTEKINVRTAHLNEAIEELNTTKIDLIFQIKNQKKLVQSITHDIKSPLRFLTNGCQYMYELSDDPQMNNVSKAIYESSFQLYNYIENLLSYSKIFLFREEKTTEVVDLFELFEEKIALFNNIAQINGNKINNELDSGFCFVANKTFLNIILHNLIDNSIKYTKEGEIYLKAKIEGDKVLISVADTGMGMSDDKMANLMDTQMPKLSEGSVGYIIIAELIGLMNGKLLIESQLDKGTIVTLTIKYEM